MVSRTIDGKVLHTVSPVSKLMAVMARCGSVMNTFPCAATGHTAAGEKVHAGESSGPFPEFLAVSLVKGIERIVPCTEYDFVSFYQRFCLNIALDAGHSSTTPFRF